MGYYLTILYIFVSMRSVLVKIVLVVAVVAVLIVQSCSIIDKVTGISEGKLVYSIEYPGLENSLLRTLMPKTMTLHFKNNVFSSELSAGGGQFVTKFISDADKRELHQSLKFGTRQLVSTLDEQGVNELNKKEFDGSTKITYLEEEKTILNLDCKKALVNMKSKDQEVEFVMYYTQDLALKDPNWAFPFNEIQGVPLQYEIVRFGIKMQFTATEFEAMEVSDELITAPKAKYRKVPYSTIEEEMVTTLQSFTEF